jgi:transposase
MLDACIHVLRSGCSWRMAPKDFPSWQVVYKPFRRRLARGLFEAMEDGLRTLWRTRQHRALDPTAAVLDSQSVKTSPQGGPKGYDAGTKVKGRKRHLVTDALGLLVAVLITTASTLDRDAAMPAVDLATWRYVVKIPFGIMYLTQASATASALCGNVDASILGNPHPVRCGSGQAPSAALGTASNPLPAGRGNLPWPCINVIIPDSSVVLLRKRAPSE